MSNVNEDDDLFADIYGDDAPKKEKSPEAAPASAPEAAPVVEAKTEEGEATSSGADQVTNASSAGSAETGSSSLTSPPVANSSIPQVQENISNVAAAAAAAAVLNPQFSGVPGDDFESKGFHAGQIYIPPKDEGKMFIGGLNWETTEERLKNYFTQFGEVLECTVMRDNATGRSRGFGFLTFRDARCVNAVMAKEHFLDGKIIDPKRAIPREEQDKTAKIFVGGVGGDVTEDDFRIFFEKYGTVIDAQLMMDKDTGRPRGFGFVTFDSDQAVERIVAEKFLVLKGKPIEVKRAEPRNRNGETLTTIKPPENNYGNMNYMNGMNPAMMSQYYQQYQQYMLRMQQMMQSGMTPQQMMSQMGGAGGANPQAMAQMMGQQQYGQSADGSSGEPGESKDDTLRGGEGAESSATPGTEMSNDDDGGYRDRGYRGVPGGPRGSRGRNYDDDNRGGRRSRSPTGPRSGYSSRGRARGRGVYGRGGGGYHPYHRN